MSEQVIAEITQNLIEAEIVTNQINVEVIVGATGGSSSWGDIGGDIYDQLDLIGLFSNYALIADLNIDEWDDAYSWGNHASAGYLTGSGSANRVAFFNGANSLSSNANFKYDTTGNNRLRVNANGVMVDSAYAGMVLSVQNIGDTGEGSWIEILNAGGYNHGAFFGMYNDNFEQYNWQGGPITFSTYPTPSNGIVRMKIANNGLIGMGGVAETAFLHLPASTTSFASFRIPSGVAPTSPNAGDIWYNGTSLFLRSTTNQAVATNTNTLTFTNKRITKRVTSTASTATPTPNADTDDLFSITALAVNATFGTPSGTPTNGQVLLIRAKDNGTARTLSYPAIYRPIGITLPPSTVVGKTTYIIAIYNSVDTKWDCVDTKTEA